MHKDKYIFHLEKKLESIQSENIRLKDQLGIRNNNINNNKNNAFPQNNINNKQINYAPNYQNQQRVNNNNTNSNPNNNQTVNNNSKIIENKYAMNSENSSFQNQNNLNNFNNNNMQQNKNNFSNNGNYFVNPNLLPQQINSNNIIEFSNVKKIEPKRPDRSSNKNIQDKNVYMDHIKTDNLNASTAKNLRSSPAIVIPNANIINSNQKNNLKNNLSNKNNQNIQKNINSKAEDFSNYEKSLYKQGLSIIIII